MRNTRKKIIRLVILWQITFLCSLEVEEEKIVLFPRNTCFFSFNLSHVTATQEKENNSRKKYVLFFFQYSSLSFVSSRRCCKFHLDDYFSCEKQLFSTDQVAMCFNMRQLTGRKRASFSTFFFFNNKTVDNDRQLKVIRFR